MRGILALAAAVAIVTAGCRSVEPGGAGSPAGEAPPALPSVDAAPAAEGRDQPAPTTVEGGGRSDDALPVGADAHPVEGAAADDLDWREAAAVDGLRAGHRAWQACVFDLGRCRPADLERSFAGPALVSFAGAARSWRAAGLVARPSPDPGHNRHRMIEVDETSDPGPGSGAGERFEILSCVVDGGVLVLPGAGPEGEEVIYDDRVVTRRELTTVIEGPDGRWRIHDRRILRRWDGDRGCDR